MDEESTFFLLRQTMVVACEPGTVGMMATGASSLDPIFWVLHPTFEKALHILKLSPGYRDTFDFTWVGKKCSYDQSGWRLLDEVPFTGACCFFAAVASGPRTVHCTENAHYNSDRSTWTVK